MKKIFSAAQLREIDAATIEKEGIASIDLMERAATAVTDAIAARWNTQRHVLVLAGPGNNGGDALAVARLLSQRGYEVDAFLFNPGNKLSADCATNRDRLAEGSKVRFTEIKAHFETPRITPDTIIIDGLFGTGSNKPLAGGFAALAKFVNATQATVVAIDMPSGLLCEDNSANLRDCIVRADLTLTFQQPKLAQLLADNSEFVGELEVLDIGLSKERMAQLTTPYVLTESADVARMLKKRNPFGHKGTFGHALLIAGRRGMAGAAILAARGCLRSGAGKLTVHTPLHNADILQISVPEAVLSLDENTDEFSAPVGIDPYAAVGIGPGLGITEVSGSAFIKQIELTRQPLVVDADGLNILAAHKSWLNFLPANSILTPHKAEFERLSMCDENDFAALKAAREMASRRKLVVVLKARHTAVCLPNGGVAFNPTGNSGMATAGSGDVLCGLLTGLLAQGYKAEEAAILGVYLHGLAGDLAVERKSEESLIASDIVEALPEAFRRLHATAKLRA